MLVFRTPLLPLSNLRSLDNFIEQFARNELRMALYIASPDLYKQLIKLNRGEISNPDSVLKIKLSLYKYYVRSCTRPTPYGLFAGVSPTSTSADGDVITSLELLKLHTRLDMQFLCDFHFDIVNTNNIKEKLYYVRNSTLYKVHDTWRYVYYHKKHSSLRTHDLVSIDDNKILSFILTNLKKPTPYTLFIEVVKRFGYKESDAQGYINGLIEKQVLIDHLYPSVTGEEYQKRFIRELETLNPILFGPLYQKINSLAISTIDNLALHIEEVKEEVNTTATRLVENRFVQVDLVKPCYPIKPDNIPLRTIEEVIKLLSQISTHANDDLKNFRTAFYEKYEETLLPISYVVDPALGIGYPAKNSATSKGNRRHKEKSFLFKLQLYKKALIEKKMEVALTEDDFKIFEKDPYLPMPTSYAVLGNLVSEKEGDKVIFQYAWGPSAVNLMGRFSHASPEIESLCLEIISEEEAMYKEAILAEVAHLPAGMIGNIASRPHFRKYEIPYLSYSTLPLDQQILPDDLYIGLRDERIVLFSKRLKKEVIPRLSCAHNFEDDALPLYKLLCDLQSQNVQGAVEWDWDVLNNQAFLPRIVYQNVIVSLAQWNINTMSIRNSLATNPANSLESINIILHDYNLPRKFVIVSGDNKLYIDTENYYGREVFVDHCKKFTELKVEEFIFSDQNTLNGFVNEIIVPFTNKIKWNPISVSEDDFTNTFNRNYTAFSEWLYIKIYTGQSSIDKILCNPIQIICKSLLEEQIITEWFFIRYSDPDHHIRIRFHLKSISEREKLILKVGAILDEYIKNGIIWDIIFNTYRPEFERYGHHTIREAEQWFYRNSELVIQLLQNGCVKTKDQLIITAMYGVNEFMNQFNYSIEDKRNFTSENMNSLLRELGLSNQKEKRKKLSLDYRNAKTAIDDLFALSDTKNSLNNSITSIFKDSLNHSQKICNSILQKVSREKANDILSSFIHMFINRLAPKNQRQTEMIVYMWLHKYLESFEAQKKYHP